MENNDSFAGMTDEAFEAHLNAVPSEESNEETPSESLPTSEEPLTLDEESVDETPTDVEESPVEAPESDLEEEHEESDEDIETEDLDEEEAPDDVTNETETEAELNAELEELYKPFKASGREISVKSVEEAKKLMSMGADYANKLQGFKVHRKTIKTLEQNDIDTDKLNLLIDASKGDKGAISKLIQEHSIDTMDLSEEEDSNYTPKDYSVSDSQVDMDDVIARIQATPSFSTTSDIVTNQWDASSKEVILSNPQHLEDLNEHVSNGTYDVVMNEVVRARTFGGLQGLTDFEAYAQVGQQMQSEGAFNKAAPETKTVSGKPKAKSQTNTDKKRRASPAKGSPTKTPVKYDYAGMSDAEFEKLLNK